jgi:hypothetical protein
MRRSSQNQAEAPGQDSFLDVVANLVGILIILIIVVGAATQKAFVQQLATAARNAVASGKADAKPADTGLNEDEVEAARAAAAAVEQDIYRTDERLREQQRELAFRRLERDKTLTMLTTVRRALDDRKAKLDQPAQEDLERKLALDEARRELAELDKVNGILAKQAPPKGIIEHLPTPMAKTVFGKEIHLRLAGNRLSIVPWDALVEQLKADAPKKIWRLRETESFTESLGPIDNFWMRYTMKRTEVTLPGRGAVQQRAELDRFVLGPVDESVGEPVEQVFRDQSEFATLVRSLDPNRATITIWVYPDSFQHYRAFKKYLFDRGFLTAARPLPEGHPIGGSPDGSRSAAE